jgi:hypothetical protein
MKLTVIFSDYILGHVLVRADRREFQYGDFGSFCTMKIEYNKCLSYWCNGLRHYLITAQHHGYFRRSWNGFPLPGNLLLWPEHVQSHRLRFPGNNSSKCIRNHARTSLISEPISFVPIVSYFMFHRFFQYYLLKPRKGHPSARMTQFIYL